VENYVPGVIWIGTETGRWKEETEERLLRCGKEIISLRAPHAVAREIAKWTEDFFRGTRSGSANVDCMTKILIIIDSDCQEMTCSLCSSHTVLNLSLDYKVSYDNYCNTELVLGLGPVQLMSVRLNDRTLTAMG
ncbi:hypothetical protein SK128_015815, partial [Halocaridina rubra]